jgi:hypothetical protein
VDDKGIEAWILSRLRAPGRELLPLDHGVALEVRERHEVEAARDLRVEGPALWLHVFRFAGHARAKAAEKPLTEALGAKHPELNYPQSTVTGAYLLVVGFPSEKPASPEMRAAQTAYLSAFAGRRMTQDPTNRCMTARRVVNASHPGRTCCLRHSALASNRRPGLPAALVARAESPCPEGYEQPKGTLRCGIMKNAKTGACQKPPTCPAGKVLVLDKAWTRSPRATCTTRRASALCAPATSGLPPSAAPTCPAGKVLVLDKCFDQCPPGACDNRGKCTLCPRLPEERQDKRVLLPPPSPRAKLLDSLRPVPRRVPARQQGAGCAAGYIRTPDGRQLPADLPCKVLVLTKLRPVPTGCVHDTQGSARCAAGYIRNAKTSACEAALPCG